MFCSYLIRKSKFSGGLCSFLKHRYCSTASEVPKKTKWKRQKDIYVEIQGDLIHGIQPVTMAIQAGRRDIFGVFYNERSSRTETIVQLCETKGIKCQKMSAFNLDDLLTKSSKYKEHTVHQGLIADVSRLYHRPLDYKMPQLDLDPLEEDEELDHPELPVWLLLCSIKDPMNLGSILRTAYFLGVDRIIVTGDRCKLSSVVSKASAGILEICPVFSLKNPVEFLDTKIAQGWQVIGTTLPSQSQGLNVKEVGQVKLQAPTIVVMGSEGQGIPPEVVDCLSLGVYIPPGRVLDSQVDSLNVAVATSIILHNLIQTKHNK